MKHTDSTIWDAQDCLVALMFAASIVDLNLKTIEMLSIERTINHLPIFADYNIDNLRSINQSVIELIEDEEGLEALFGLVKNALPEKLYETAYALCCDIAAADGRLRESELRLLQEMRYEFNLHPLHSAAIEQSAKARHMVL